MAFVTGGAPGIGRATVVALAGKGASVVLTDLDEDGAEQSASYVLPPDARPRWVRRRAAR